MDPGLDPDRLRPDCARCFGLCCVAPAFAVSADFAIDKHAGQPCPHLAGDFRCAIHARLCPEGFPGCAAYDCFGAGQQVAQVTFAGEDWRGSPERAALMFRVFGVMRQLHELLWHVAQALAMPEAAPVHDALAAVGVSTLCLTRGTPEEIAALDAGAHHQAVNTVLRQAGELARSVEGAAGPDHRGEDLSGRDLRRAALRGASMRGARLIGADLRRVDLSRADLTGADLRGARVGGALVAQALFLTQSQLDTALGDAATIIPPGLTRPARWPQSSGPGLP